MLVQWTYSSIELRRKQCRRVRVVILHVPPCVVYATLNTRKLWSQRPHSVAPEVAAPRHGNARNVHGVSGCRTPDKHVIPLHPVRIDIKFL